MIKIQTFIGLLSMLVLSSQTTFALTKIDLLNNMAERLKLASQSFNGHIDSEINTINQAPNGSSDAPNSIPPSTFMTGGLGAGNGMICYYSDSLTIAASSDPNYNIGEKFDKKVATRISKAMKKDVAEIERNISITDKNDGSKKSEKIITVAWQGKKLTGKDTSKLVCLISATVPGS
ncbi:MAG: hypothetical protein V4482_04725 [Pseudomonadota bacterium]